MNFMELQVHSTINNFIDSSYVFQISSMANIQDFEIEELVADRKESQNIGEQGSDSLVSVTAKDDSELSSKNKELLGNVCCLRRVRSKFKSRRSCLWSSKAAVLILAWNFTISLGLVGFLDPSLYSLGGLDPITIGGVYAGSAILHLFYPLAGWLADIKWGRYTTVVNSLYFTFWSTIIMVMIPLVISSVSENDPILSTVQTVIVVIVSVVFGLPVLSGTILLICSQVAFSANVIQFGIDQLRDAPTDYSVLYIYWYVWTSNLGYLILRIPFAAVPLGDYAPLAVISMLIPFVPLFLGITLCLKCCSKNQWFLIDPGSKNPYKLVYQVVKFASKHKVPVDRSAFTYCEDELPSRLDLGKDKYGGPFKTEEVEDVKAFWGILYVLFATGPAFLVDIAVSGIPTRFTQYTNTYSNDTKYDAMSFTFYGSGCLTPLIIVVLIPVYLFLLRPFIHDYIPGMLKRMGMGMALLLISCLCTLLMGVANHDCTLEEEFCQITTYFAISPHFLIIQFSLNAIGYMLFYIAIYEFICAQSPHSMKGLLIGIHFAIKGIFQLLGVLIVYTPITVGCDYRHEFPICGFVYFLVNTLVAFIGLIVFVIVARRYKKRERDEPDNIYRYAEEYYDNDQGESYNEYYNYDSI